MNFNCTAFDPLTITAKDYLSLPEPQVSIAPTAPLIEEGYYKGRLLCHATRFDFGAPKLFLYFLILKDDVEYARLFKAYPVKLLTSPPNLNGSYRFGPKSNAALDVMRLRKEAGLSNDNIRNDRLDFRFLTKHELTLKVVTVDTDHQGKKKSADERYSKVDHIAIDGYW